jgi:hypothetical protein
MSETPLSIDLIGTTELLDRLKLVLEFRVHDQPAPQLGLEIQVQFSTQLNSVCYSRLDDGSLWFYDTQIGAVAYLMAQSTQMDLWYGNCDGDRRYFWHSFVRVAVAIYLSDRDYTPIHAAALVDPMGMLWLFGGYTHAGKSTLTIGLLEAGWSYLGDDGVVLADSQSGIVAHSWWGSILLDPILATTYPHLSEYLGDWIGKRRLINLRKCYGSKWVEQQVPTRLVFPVLDAAEPLARLAPLSNGMALSQSMQHSAPWLLESPQSHLVRLKALCSQSDCLELHLGLAARTQPHLVAKILASM